MFVTSEINWAQLLGIWTVCEVLRWVATHVPLSQSVAHCAFTSWKDPSLLREKLDVDVNARKDELFVWSVCVREICQEQGGRSPCVQHNKVLVDGEM